MYFSFDRQMNQFSEGSLHLRMDESLANEVGQCYRSAIYVYIMSTSLVSRKKIVPN